MERDSDSRGPRAHDNSTLSKKKTEKNHEMKIESSALEQVCVTESEKKLKLSPKKLIRFTRCKIVLKDTESFTKIRIRPQDTGPSTEILVRPQRYWSVHEESDLSTRILDRPQAESCFTPKFGVVHRNRCALSTFVLT